MYRTVTAAAIALSLLSGAPASADLAQGVAAFENGDYPAAMAAWRPLAEAGDSDSQFYIGFLYHNGLGVARDDLAASQWYRKAAEQDHREAAKQLALINFAGEYMWTSKLQGVEWFRRAAELGDIDSQGFMGLVYREGWGVSPDRIEALKWFALAAAQGHKNATRDRDALIATMPSADVAEAKKRLRDWRAGHPQG